MHQKGSPSLLPDHICSKKITLRKNCCMYFPWITEIEPFRRESSHHLNDFGMATYIPKLQVTSDIDMVNMRIFAFFFFLFVLFIYFFWRFSNISDILVFWHISDKDVPCNCIVSGLAFCSPWNFPKESSCRCNWHRMPKLQVQPSRRCQSSSYSLAQTAASTKTTHLNFCGAVQ